MKMLAGENQLEPDPLIIRGARLTGSRGFSLLELLVAVTIIGILAAIAIPIYQDSVERTRRTAAQADLVELSQWMERQYSDGFDYRDGGANPTLPFSTSPRNSANPFYNISFQGAVTQTAYTLQAVPTAVQNSDDCGTMTINQNNTRTADEPDCW